MARETQRATHAQHPKHPEEWGKKELADFLDTLGCPPLGLTGAQFGTLSVEELAARLGEGHAGKARLAYQAWQHAVAKGEVARRAVNPPRTTAAAAASRRHTNLTFAEPSVEALLVALDAGTTEAWARASAEAQVRPLSLTPFFFFGSLRGSQRSPDIRNFRNLN